MKNDEEIRYNLSYKNKEIKSDTVLFTNQSIIGMSPKFKQPLAANERERKKREIDEEKESQARAKRKKQKDDVEKKYPRDDCNPDGLNLNNFNILPSNGF